MNSAQIEIQLIASLVAIACAIPGTFLVLRKMAMISDAISHSILPGIVIGFFITQNLNSPLLILFAAFTGVDIRNVARFDPDFISIVVSRVFFEQTSAVGD